MNTLMNSLKFTYSPLTAYEFDMFRNDSDIYNFLESTNLYIIARRKLPIMNLINGNQDGFHISVQMENDSNKLELMMLKDDNPKLFGSGLYKLDCGNNTNNKECFHSLTLYGENDRFIMTANFDRLMHLWRNKIIVLRSKDEYIFEPYITYEVLYVGQCTGEHIYKRFKSHHALQSILINENIIPDSYDKVNELLLLPFRINGDVLSIIDSDTREEDFNRAVTGNFGFDINTIALDCEKALIKAIDPKYNKTKFLKYPKSKDGLFGRGMELIEYSIHEDIILKYQNDNYIFGDINGVEATRIIIECDSDETAKNFV